MKLSDIKIDAAAIEEGRWIDAIPDMGDLRLKVRGFGNADYRRLQAKLVAAVPRAKRNDPAETDRMLARLLAETVLQDWEGITDDNGNLVPFDREFAETLLLDPAMVRFREAVQFAAAVVGEEASEAAKDDAKN